MQGWSSSSGGGASHASGESEPMDLEEDVPLRVSLSSDDERMRLSGDLRLSENTPLGSCLLRLTNGEQSRIFDDEGELSSSLILSQMKQQHSQPQLHQQQQQQQQQHQHQPPQQQQAHVYHNDATSRGSMYHSPNHQQHQHQNQQHPQHPYRPSPSNAPIYTSSSSASAFSSGSSSFSSGSSSSSSLFSSSSLSSFTPVVTSQPSNVVSNQQHQQQQPSSTSTSTSSSTSHRCLWIDHDGGSHLCNLQFQDATCLGQHLESHLTQQKRCNRKAGRRGARCWWQGCSRGEEKPFGSRYNLQLHLRYAHTGERPYVCSTCGAAFAQRTDMEHHEKSHGGAVKKKATQQSSVITQQQQQQQQQQPPQLKSSGGLRAAQFSKMTMDDDDDDDDDDE